MEGRVRGAAADEDLVGDVEVAARGSGVYQFDSGDLNLSLHAEPAKFADLLWAYPDLPPKAHGKFDMRLAWHGPVSDYQFTNADLAMGNARGSGSFGITFDDTVTVRNTRVRFAQLDTRTIEEIFPNFSSPRRGVLSGLLVASGGKHALAIDGDVTFDDASAGVSRVRPSGLLGLAGHAVRFKNMRVEMLPVRVALARTWRPSLPIDGSVTGTVTLNGSTDDELTVKGNVDHIDNGARSILNGSVRLRLAGPTWFDVNVMAQPVSLAEVGRFLPSAGLRGSATGPVHLTGSLRDLRTSLNLQLADGGHVSTEGTFDLASREKGYDFNAQLSRLNLRAATRKLPSTRLTGHVAARGRGFDPGTMHAMIDADLAASRWDTLTVDTVSARVSLDTGLATVQRLYASGSHAVASLSGTFGLTRERSGVLAYRVSIDSLGAFNRWIPQPKTAGAPIEPRPRVRARAYQLARADSARLARATEIDRLLKGKPAPKLRVNVPKAIPADTLGGSLHAEGSVRGNIYVFDVRGKASGENVVARGNFVQRFETEYAWLNVRTPQNKLAVGVDAANVSAMGFGFDTVSARFTYSDTGGHAEMVVIQDRIREYSAKGDYSLNPSRDEVRLANLTLRFDTTFWSMPRPAVVRWGPTGVFVGDFALHDRDTGRVYANGLLPTKGKAQFTLDVDNFPMASISDILQTDVDLRGSLTLHGTLTGTVQAPAFKGTFAVVGGKYNTATIPELRGRFGYADRAIVTHADLLRKNGLSMATIDGRIPINLALTGVTGSRIPAEQMSIQLVADSLPLELIPELTNVVSNVHGSAQGQLAVRGTLRKPVLAGAFTLKNGTVTVTSTGATFDMVTAVAHMSNDTVYIDSLAGNANGPVRVRGTLALTKWNEPSFNLFLTSSGAELLHNEHGRVRADAGLSLVGPYRAAYLSGAVTITQGVIYAPEPTGRHVISAGDPALFNVIDTAVTTERELFPAESPFFANLRVDVSLNVRHNTWVRNREANIEIYTDDPVLIHAEEEALSLTGIVTSDRGSYNFLSKRFQIKRGAAIFVGGPELNPTLQLTGEYQVELPSKGALNIRVLIGGTLKKLTLSLESDAQPPRTQSELLSLLAFGQSATTLLASGQSSIAGSAATSDLFGVGAQVAARRLAGVALGVAANEVEMEAGKAFGTDIFDITPSDIPSGNIVANLFVQTKFEAGKYVNPRTFVTVSQQAGRPGFGIEHRTADGWQFNASISPRILLGEPMLTSQPFRIVQVYGGFIVREWRF